MLNSNEVKELIRCFETRNDCAHPSNFICSAEKARDIFSSIIDIICSKPVLFGCNSIDKIISDLEGEIFFPNLENEKVKDIVQSNIDKFHSKAIEPLLKKIGNTIINTNDNTQRENAIYFLALSEKCIDNYNEDYLKEFLKDRNEIYLLRLLGINSDILNCFTDIEIERLMQRFKNCLKTMQINNLDDWIKVLLSKRIIENNYFYTTLDNLFNMDFYYPGKGKSGDLPPRKNFAKKWHDKVLELMPNLELIVLVGKYAQDYYLGNDKKQNLTETVYNYKQYLPRYFPIVHPSPLNFHWHNKNPWFIQEVVPELKKRVKEILQK